MRRIDKKLNIIKANILAESRYLESKGLLKEEVSELDFKNEINNVLEELRASGLPDYKFKGVENELNQIITSWIKIANEKNIPDNRTISYIKDDFEDTKKSYLEIAEKERGENEKKAKIEKIKQTETLLGKKIIDLNDNGVLLEDDSVIYIDDNGRGERIIYEPNDGDYKWQSCSSSFDYNRAKNDFNQGDSSNIIFPTKKEAKKFLDILKIFNNGKAPSKVKLKFIFTPDSKETVIKDISEETFNDFKGMTINIKNYVGDVTPYIIDDIDFYKTDFSDYVRYTITFHFSSKKLYDNTYSLTYSVKILKLRNSKQEEVEFKSRQFLSSVERDENLNRYPEVVDILNKIKAIVNQK